MAVGEVLLSAFFAGLTEMLKSREVRDFATQLVGGVDSALKKLEETLGMIQALLNDAEEKEQTNPPVKLWLDKLQDWAYDAEDILDEFSYEALRRKLNAKHPACMPNFTPCPVKFNLRMWKQIKDVTSRLELLYKQKNDLGLQLNSPVGTSNAAPLRPPSTSLTNETVVCGRHDDVTKIREMVLCDKPSNDANFHVIPIVGMGGIGKTTLAREVYNDKMVDDSEFHIKAWVCVSDKFDAFGVSKALLEEVTRSPCTLNELNGVQNQLKNAVDGKKILLVLDDVWNALDYELWRNLKAPFMGAASGSKILVTTRDEGVALMVRTAEDNQYNLEFLSDEDCWNIFKKHAFEKDSDAEGIPESIRKKFIQKCKGLPLAAMTLAGVIRSEGKDEGVWNDVLNSRFWDLPAKNNVLPVLRLSYHYLPSYLKRCFAYCAIFPKDYEFDESELILLWMGEGLLLQSQTDEQPEDMGKKHFRGLLSRGLLQKSSRNYSKFVMHDLIHDLAQSVAENTSFGFEDANVQQISEEVRHVSYGNCDFKVFRKFEDLRTFIPLIRHDYDENYLSNMVLLDLLPKFKKLRVLSLAGSYIIQLPDSIGGMKHLRYLNFSETKLKSLPESITLLLKLQILILRKCYFLGTLPSNMRDLVNLRYLDVAGTPLKEMPRRMRELKDLRMLSNFVVGKDSGSDLEDLRNLKFLQGELDISGLENVVGSQVTNEKILYHHKYLKVVSLFWSSAQFDNSPNDQVRDYDENILDMLEPHGNLEELTIHGYSGFGFPNWLGDPSFSRIVVLNLEDCYRSQTLPSLGILGSLEKLSIKGMQSLKHLGFEIYGDCLKPFKTLKTLYFENLPEWESWKPNEEKENVGRFSCLRELSIVKCPKLVGKLPDDLSSLEKLVIRECVELVVSFSSIPTLRDLKIDDCKEIVYSGSPVDLKSLNSMSLSKVSKMRNWLQQGFYQIKSLSIVDSQDLSYLWQNMTCVQMPFQGMQSFTSLEELCIDNCTSLHMFPTTDFLPNLTSLTIRNCMALKSLPEGILLNKNATVESLKIKGCDSLTFVVRGMLPSSLKCLEIRNCGKLECLVDDKEDICASSSFSFAAMMSNSLLEKLYIDNCPSLTCISTRGQLPVSTRGQLPVSLKELEIKDCPQLDSITERFDYNMCLKSISLWDCEKLKSIPEGLHNLSCLERITLIGCSSVVSLPKEGLPNSIESVCISHCKKFEALPDRMHNLHALRELIITYCENMASLPTEGLPTSLTHLCIYGGLKIYKSVVEWGLHNLTSLQALEISVLSEEEIRMRLPASLTSLDISDFPNLKYLSPEGFQSLNSLKWLTIWDCPRLTSLPEVKLPSSLFKLKIRRCPSLNLERKGDKGKKWPNISHIPCVKIDDDYI